MLLRFVLPQQSHVVTSSEVPRNLTALLMMRLCPASGTHASRLRKFQERYIYLSAFCRVSAGIYTSLLQRPIVPRLVYMPVKRSIVACIRSTCTHELISTDVHLGTPFCLRTRRASIV